MAENEIKETPKAPAAQPAPVTKSEKGSGNIIKRNQTSDNIEITLPTRVVNIGPYGIVQLTTAEWNSSQCKPYHKILK